MSEYAGSTFERGLYRLHTQASSALANRAVADAHPELDAKIECFGYDWLGRQFAADTAAAGAESVWMIEPGTGEILAIPASFADFHNTELVAYRDAALASTFFDQWSQQNPAALPLRPDRCVGYRVPLFLGGRDELDNLEETDLWVYWLIAAQLTAKAGDLHVGHRITRVTIE